MKPHPFNIVKRHNYMQALHMLCVKMGWTKEYSYYILGRSPESCANGGKKEFIKKATRILAYNYEGIHTGAEPALSPRLLPESNPLSQPLRMPPEFEGESKMSLNVVTVIGRLGGNPEIMMFNSGTQRIRFSIAVNRDYKDEDGNRPIDWIPVIGWGKGCANYATATHLAKGDEICISGRLENTHWQDENGENRTGFCINVDRMYLTSKKRSKDGASAENAQPKNDVAYENPAYADEENLPF